jgi:hypothetical protein
MIRNASASVWLAAIAVAATSTLAVNAQNTPRQAVKQQLDIQATSAALQNRIDGLDDQAREMVNEYRQATAQINDLEAYNLQLERLVATQNVELADYERQFRDIETTKRQILPLILRMLEVLEEFVAADMPFLPDERRLRLTELKSLMGRPDVPTSEKYRRVAEAYQIELEYGHTIEGYEGEIQTAGQTRTVAFLRYGRLGLYYMTLDGLEIGHWDKNRDDWMQLDDSYRQSLDRAMRIARKQLPPDLTRLPVPAPETKS